jgi:hypothetical protein
MSDMQLEPGTVNAAGDRLQDGGVVIGRVATGFGATEALTGRAGALASAEALGACRKNWSERIGQQGTESALLGQVLHDAVQAYLAADRRSADDMRGHSRNMAI